MSVNVFEVQGRIKLNAEEYIKSLEAAKQGMEKFGDNIGKIKNKLADFAKVSAAALGAGAAAVGALVKQSVDAYASYEQLVGGVDTLFKESSDKVQEYADNAYKTAGMSANQYMETVTSFSASLIQATGRNEKQDIEALKATLDEEYNETKRNLSDRYDDEKSYWDERIKLAENSDEKTILQQQKNDELKILKRANEDSLAELKKLHQAQIDEATAANNVSVTTEESLAKAADLANQAIIDMADNANKMGYFSIEQPRLNRLNCWKPLRAA